MEKVLQGPTPRELLGGGKRKRCAARKEGPRIWGQENLGRKGEPPTTQGSKKTSLGEKNKKGGKHSVVATMAVFGTKNASARGTT